MREQTLLNFLNNISGLNIYRQYSKIFKKFIQKIIFSINLRVDKRKGISQIIESHPDRRRNVYI